MKLHLDTIGGINIIKAYEDDCIVVNDARHYGSVILSPEKISPNWSITHMNNIDENACEEIQSHSAEIVLLGTGHTHEFAPAWMQAWFSNRGMGLEAMATPAACRTYNVLAGEQRRVVAALIINSHCTDSG
ncbi:MAG: membrane protein [marine bacterium B5-7]|nr:MAG: membrane protein [marine bacterium B5-7]